MISADTNIFIHAFDARSPHNAAARAFLEEHLGNGQFAICELVLIELYMALRNPAVFQKPLSAAAAVALCSDLLKNNGWQYIEYDPAIRKNLWEMAKKDTLGFRQIIDIRLGLVLKFLGVEEFATVNTKHFKPIGFHRLWNPLIEKT